jgi:hypothetical protein
VKKKQSQTTGGTETKDGSEKFWLGPVDKAGRSEK